jgi:mono/diheme cytochrome c family protein
MKRWFGLLLGLTLPVCAADEAIEHFEKAIRPILAKNCYACHTNAALGGLRVDSKEALLKGGKSGAALVAGNPDASLLLKAVLQNDAAIKQMPPTGKLAETEIALLRDWIAKGAAMPEKRETLPTAGKEYVISPEQRSFWSYQPVLKPALPSVKRKDWVKTEIDRFVLAKLEAQGLQLARAAGKRDLLRRVTYSLTGLPPTIEEVRAFEADASPKAFEKVVDRLLASPRYGERWGRLWLDLARYSDDKLNSTQDEPYPNSFRYRNWVIDAFNRDLPYDTFVKAQIAGDLMPSKNPAQYAAGTGFFALSPEMQDERVDALTKTFLGLTVGCAQCHDHKFDPIPTKDYYSLQGILSSSQLHELPLAEAEVVKSWKARKAEVDLVEKRIKDFYDKQSALLGEIFASGAAAYLLATQDETPPAGLDLETVKKFRKYVAADRLYHPFLNQFRLLVKAKAPRADLEKEAAAFQKLLLEVVDEKKVVDEKNKIKLGLDPSRNDLSQTQLDAMDRDRTVLWRDFFERTISDAGGAFNYGSGVFYYGKGTIERFLSGHWKQYLDEQNKVLEARKKELPEQYPFLQTLNDKDKPADMNILIRGDRNNKGDLAPRRFLAILSGEDRPLFHQGSGRLQLAEAIADAKNPLTARVMVNRVWQFHFGRGIVATSSNFGQLGERPTHPELLDYLAATFVEDGWSLKKLHKRILLSNTFQLAAENVEANLSKDPANVYLWRANLRRLDAEAIRDSLLFASGELDLTASEKAPQIEDEKNMKRTVYSFIGRRKLDGYLALFDFPAPLASSEARMSTNVPLQRLYFMNSGFVGKRADVLADKLQGSNADKIRQAYRMIYAREADAEEVRLGEEYLTNAAWPSYVRALLSANEFLFTN